MNLINREPFANIFLAKITDTPKMYLAYALTVAYSSSFSSPVAFTYMVGITPMCAMDVCITVLLYTGRILAKILLQSFHTCNISCTTNNSIAGGLGSELSALYNILCRYKCCVSMRPVEELLD